MLQCSIMADGTDLRLSMHRSAIHPDVARRVIERRGGLRVFDGLAPARTVHVVVDLQNGFMAPGAAAELPAAREIVPNVNRISAVLRAPLPPALSLKGRGVLLVLIPFKGRTPPCSPGVASSQPPVPLYFPAFQPRLQHHKSCASA
jgi:hypothetical protein